MLDIKGLSFQWPELLWLLVILAPLVWLYWRSRLPKASGPSRYPGLVGQMQAQNKWWTRITAIAFLLGLIALLLAVARPQALLALPLRQIDLVFVIDTSASMRATDTKPNRLAAAQEIAKNFIADLPVHVRVGVVSVAATASLVQSPTKDREALAQAIDRLEAQKGTALGSGIVIALATLRPDADLDVEKLTTGRSSRQWGNDPTKPANRDIEKQEPGSNTSKAVIVLSDGKPTLGPDLKEVTKLAADLGIRVYTVGVGTTHGGTVKLDGVSMRTKLEEEALQLIAKETMAEYYQGASGADLKAVFKSLNARLVLEKPKQTEITSLFIGLGAALILIGAMVSVFRQQRIL